MFKTTTYFNRFKANYDVFYRNVNLIDTFENFLEDVFRYGRYESITVRHKYNLDTYKAMKVQNRVLLTRYKNGKFRVLTLNAYGVQLDYKVN